MTELYEMLQQQKASILDIAKHYHAANIRVFGSVVRGEESRRAVGRISRANPRSYPF
ncbi:hypothetical protein [Methyloglobulus sp.]|uniref:hypothetical protein n=1 Tax=Methyloglobulus sp. TaxID=2518622 RepID=UPI003988EDAE